MTHNNANPAQIRSLRKKLRLSPEDFASRLGFTGKDRRITVWRWENGKREPSKQTVLLMKALLRQ
jgi:DNA-binding transcriptional regulator YiaG